MYSAVSYEGTQTQCSIHVTQVIHVSPVWKRSIPSLEEELKGGGQDQTVTFWPPTWDTRWTRRCKNLSPVLTKTLLCHSSKHAQSVESGSVFRNHCFVLDPAHFICKYLHRFCILPSKYVKYSWNHSEKSTYNVLEHFTSTTWKNPEL